jgi:glucosylceramidase
MKKNEIISGKHLQFNWLFPFILLLVSSCKTQPMKIELYETNRGGKLFEKTEIPQSNSSLSKIQIELFPEQKHQKITGFGGSFTESTCYLLNQIGEQNKTKILKAYFDENEANYSLTRTTIGSCDFSLDHYTYAPIENDTLLDYFSIEHDQKNVIPIIKEANKISQNSFQIIASPWTAPIWMKDNKNWVGGKLLPSHYPTFARYFQKYLEAYKQEGIPIWGITVINEPHGNGNNWESTHFSPTEMTDFVEFHLGPTLEKSDFKDVKILGYDQNRAGLKEWVDEMYRSPLSSKYYSGTAIHWYESTYDYFPEALNYAHSKMPQKHLIQTEACIDSEVPHWKEDDWYWRKEATDWGWDWASEAEKYLHPKYAPIHRYASDIIGCLNHGVDGWIDWNMVLDKQGGPNWFKNWCIAPVLVDPEIDEVYFTPLYYVMKHFSKFIRPGAFRIEWTLNQPTDLQITAIQNPDKSVVVVVFNPLPEKNMFELKLGDKKQQIEIAAESIQTLKITPEK